MKIEHSTTLKQTKGPVDPVKKAREHIRNGTYIVKKHALDRQKERAISLPDILYVLETGFHEEGKNTF